MIIALQTLFFFRESLLTPLDRLLRPYYKQLTLAFSRNGTVSEDEEADDQVFAEYDDEKGVVFYPPMYAQRYAAVSDCLMDDRWCGKLEKVVDFGYHDMSFIKYLKEVPGVRCILGVDIETIPLRCSSDLLGGDEYSPKRESPLQVTLFQGNAADPDYRLIGCDAVVAIEMIEHMLPHDLDRLVHTIFGFIKPWVVVFTTPNADFNVLFKSLEKNGRRRWDHLFEWTREQFNDWCSNIVVRYPLYSVTCQGVGPGPPGTLHYGCCSQLALFVSKHYHKQADLHVNSLALVANAPSPNNFSEMFEGWESSDNTTPIETDCTQRPPQKAASITELLYPEKQSHMTLVISSTLCPSLPFSEPNYSMDTYPYRDQTLQCNLDSEIGKSFMMFDHEQYYDVVVPRRTVKHRVYEIEDVYSRLNCTTLQVKKFSKTTQNLMAKNKIDSLVHTREVVNEIRHLTKTLNFNKFSRPEDGTYIWSNINWGDNAPYWNQYYKTVREYIYPFEAKSDEVRILDLVSDEINRLIDSQYDEESSVDVNRLEIPLTHLMTVVEHITDDVNRVRDLLEWNGYEIVDDVVIHSRLVVDATSVATHEEDWQETDTLSDWDTDVHSTTVSDGSTIVPDYNARCLRRALDLKVRNLRTMLSADEDITTELDRVVCRLMKLALRSSRGRTTPPPTRWMQCKLLDLLTLTEKAIGRRKKHFIESYPVKTLEFDNKIDQEVKFEEDTRVKEIVDKYRHLLQPLEKTTNTDETNVPLDLDIEDDFMSTTSNEFLKDFEFIEGISPSLVIPQPVFSSEAFEIEQPPQKENSLERTKAWLDEDVEVVPYVKHEIDYENISSGHTDHSIAGNAEAVRHKQKKSNKKHKAKQIPNKEEIHEVDTAASKQPAVNKISSIKYKIKRDYKNSKKKTTNAAKKIVKNKAGFNSLVKNPDDNNPSFDNYVVKPKRKCKEPQSFNVNASKPIPESLIELCHPELKTEKAMKGFRVINTNNEPNVVISNVTSISATEESYLVDIVMQDFEETIALRRTIGTDADAEPEIASKDEVETISNDFDINLCTKHEVSTENVHSQTIFLNDINEPSTSKGIRHNISMDVQCGPDTLAAYPMLSASTSLVRMPQVFSTGIKINDVVPAYTKVTEKDFGTSTQQDNNNLTTITPRPRSVGIKIKDSDVNMFATNTESSVMTIPDFVPPLPSAVASIHRPKSHSSAMNSAASSHDTRLLKAISSALKIEDSGSEFLAPSMSSMKALSYCMNVSKHASDVLMESSVSKEMVTEKKTSTKYVRPRLCCGGVHVHSYRDKQVSEDIVYQGEWQRYRPKALARKKTFNVTATRKTNEASKWKKKENIKEKKEKELIKRQDIPKIATAPERSLQKRHSKVLKIRREDVTQDLVEKLVVPNNVGKITINSKKIPRPIKTVAKVASKIALSSIPSKNLKSTFTVKRPAILPNVVAKKEIDSPQKLKRSYIPLYLKRTQPLSAGSGKNNLNKSLDSANNVLNLNIGNTAKKIPTLVRSKTEEIRKDLLKFTDKVRDNINYCVFRNDLEDKIGAPDDDTSESNRDRKRNNGKQLEIINRSHSPQSLNSSTCSSPNSVATVRAASTRVKNMSCRRHSASSYKAHLPSSESENATSTKTKKMTKRCKSAKKSDSKKDIHNKENIPESTKNFGSKDKVSKLLVARPKSVHTTKVKPEGSSTPNNLSRHKVQISNRSHFKIPLKKDGDEKRKSSSPTVSKKRSLKSATSSIFEDLNQSQTDSFGSSDSTNMVLVLEPQQIYEELSGLRNISQISSEECSMKNNANLTAEWVRNASLHSHRSSILNSMRQILEDTVDLIVSPHDANMRHIDSKTIILSRDEDQKTHKEKKLAPGSQTGITPGENLNGSVLEKDNENALNRTFDTVLGNESMVSLNDSRLTVTDLDLLSFKSITSVSKYSEYFLADSEFNIQALDQSEPHSTSVQDIFERKETHLIQSNPGALAVQAFSGFSLDAEPVAGDRPDPVALIDSETGSVGLDITRQATSEELFISGRSSESYQSCLIDEDSVVPNWLFQIISHQQQSVDEEQPALLGPLPAPLDEPMYDANGNIIEPSVVGVGAGAGDGRGMHSDHSQDSSGRGTSLSSSDTSSGPQSEVSAILIDPSTYTGQFELLHDPMAGPVVSAVDANHASLDRTYRIDDDPGTLSSSHNDRMRILNGASDIDADISSTDTDVPDSSDN